MLTELLESDAGVAVARLSSLLHVEGTDMEVVPVDVASVVKEGVYFGRCTGAVRRVRCGDLSQEYAAIFRGMTTAAHQHSGLT